MGREVWVGEKELWERGARTGSGLAPFKIKRLRAKKRGIKYMSMHAAVNWFAEVFLAQTWGHKEHQ